MTESSTLPYPRVNGEHKPFFKAHTADRRDFAVKSSQTFLPPSLPSAPFKLDFTMLMVSTSDLLESASSSPQFREYLTLRKMIKQIESELISAQMYVDAEVKAYYSNIKEKKIIHSKIPESLSSSIGSSSSSTNNLRESDAVLHLKDLEKRYLVAYLRYLFLSVSLLDAFSPLHSSPSLSTLCLPSPPETPPETPPRRYTYPIPDGGSSAYSSPPWHAEGSAVNDRRRMYT